MCPLKLGDLFAVQGSVKTGLLLQGLQVTQHLALLRETERWLAVRLRCALLHHVRQLVGQQAPAGIGPRPIGALVEGNVVTDRERVGAQLTAHPYRIGIGVDAHAAKAVSHPLLEKAALRIGQGLTAASHTVDASLQVGGDRARFLLAGLDARDGGQATLLAKKRGQDGVRHLHHGIGHTVGFPLVLVTGLADSEADLDNSPA